MLINKIKWSDIMVNFFARIFIKDYKNIEDSKIRNKYGKMAGILGIISNTILFIIKLIGGLLTHSFSIITDAINNLSDMGSSLFTLIGFKLSAKPADKEHPFGHERIEYVTGLVISFIILFIGGEFLLTSFEKVFSNQKITYSYAVIILLFISIVIKILQGLFYKNCGKIISSVTLEASSSDSFFDCISTSVILIGAIISKIFSINIDGYLGIIVSLFIIYNGIKLVKETINPLIGINLDSKILNSVLNDIKSYEGVLGYHDVISHMYGPKKCFMSLHVEMSADINPLISHEQIDKIENDIYEKYKIELVIHYDPVSIDETTVKLKNEVEGILNSIDKELSFHDFRIVKGVNRTNLVFDIVIPFNFKLKEEDILDTIKNKLNENSQMKYVLVVKFDKKIC